METTTFRIRAYGVGELAGLYNPHLTHRRRHHAALALDQLPGSTQRKTDSPRLPSGAALLHPEDGGLHCGAFGGTVKEKM